ncbi:Arv1-domain-containing protein [Daedaleopsis nitida]|nr:Arv1-domain-containing protein [Daedaleopsis nitida]
MPICTTCTTPAAHLYTVYDSKYNFRLEQCTSCHAFADPYVEHDTLTLLLDLILLKRDVYRHLLYNRGLGARRASGRTSTKDGERQREHTSNLSQHQHGSAARWWLIVRLGFALICVDAFIRWTHISSNQTGDSAQIAAITSWNQLALRGFLRILVGCVFETAAFHAGVVLACYLVLKALPSPPPDPSAPVSGIRAQFRYSHIPLTLLYSSLTKLFLLFCLSIWRPDASNAAHGYESGRLGHGNGNGGGNGNGTWHPLAARALALLDEDTLDREWVVRNVLGGMAAGFGLRVVLDCHPVFTTLIILAGWLVKTAVASLVGGWVTVDDKAAGEMWLAYSIP